MKKTIIAIAAVLASAITASAVDYKHKLIVNKADGTKGEYKFEDTPVATVEGDDLKIELASTRESVLYPIADLASLTFEKKEYDSVECIGDDSTRVSFGISREALEVSGLTAGASVSVHDLSGMLRATGVCDASGSVTLDIGSLGNGVYIVEAGNNTFKFIR